MVVYCYDPQRALYTVLEGYGMVPIHGPKYQLLRQLYNRLTKCILVCIIGWWLGLRRILLLAQSLLLCYDPTYNKRDTYTKQNYGYHRHMIWYDTKQAKQANASKHDYAEDNPTFNPGLWTPEVIPFTVTICPFLKFEFDTHYAFLLGCVGAYSSTGGNHIQP